MVLQYVRNQNEHQRNENLHAFSKEQVIHDFDNIFRYTSLAHAWCAESKFSPPSLGVV